MTQTTLDLCKAGISAWQQAFNAGDAAGCAANYAQDAIMVAKPFGTFRGQAAIEAFWADLISQGFAEVAYTDVDWNAHSEGGYVLSSKWTMNNAFGVVHKEHWQVQADGQARLTYDEFEVLGER